MGREKTYFVKKERGGQSVQKKDQKMMREFGQEKCNADRLATKAYWMNGWM